MGTFECGIKCGTKCGTVQLYDAFIGVDVNLHLGVKAATVALVNFH